MELTLDIGCADGVRLLDDAIRNPSQLYIGCDIKLGAVADSPKGFYDVIKQKVINLLEIRLGSKTRPLDGLVDEGLSRYLSSIEYEIRRRENKLRAGKINYDEVLAETLRRMDEHPTGRVVSNFRLDRIMGPNNYFYHFYNDTSPELSDMSLNDFLKSDPPSSFSNHYRQYTDRIEVVLGDAFQLPFRAGSFDHVTIVHFSHQTDDDARDKAQFEGLESEAIRVTKTGGDIIIYPVPDFLKGEYQENAMRIEISS
ncbi:MAG: class I SAM-dependent methyltransferase [Candidatus Aenigmarchaeota archaeon]|nr:class I SAM-dependent methyltransferase [Candidatus Aenigmarchaeota archaeon]